MVGNSINLPGYKTNQEHVTFALLADSVYFFSTCGTVVSSCYPYPDPVEVIVRGMKPKTSNIVEVSAKERTPKHEGSGVGNKVRWRTHRAIPRKHEDWKIESYRYSIFFVSSPGASHSTCVLQSRRSMASLWPVPVEATRMPPRNFRSFRSNLCVSCPPRLVLCFVKVSLTLLFSCSWRRCVV